MPAPTDLPLTVVNASDTRFGDYQSNAAMIVAKAVKTNPRQLAELIKTNFDGAGICAPPEIAGQLANALSALADSLRNRAG